MHLYPSFERPLSSKSLNKNPSISFKLCFIPLIQNWAFSTVDTKQDRPIWQSSHPQNHQVVKILHHLHLLGKEYEYHILCWNLHTCSASGTREYLQTIKLESARGISALYWPVAFLIYQHQGTSQKHHVEHLVLELLRRANHNLYEQDESVNSKLPVF